MQKSGHFLPVALAALMALTIGGACHRKTDEQKGAPQNRAAGGPSAPPP